MQYPRHNYAFNFVDLKQSFQYQVDNDFIQHFHLIVEPGISMSSMLISPNPTGSPSVVIATTSWLIRHSTIS